MPAAVFSKSPLSSVFLAACLVCALTASAADADAASRSPAGGLVVNSNTNKNTIRLHSNSNSNKQPQPQQQRAVVAFNKAAEPAFCTDLNKTLSEVGNCTLVSCAPNAPAGVLIKCNAVVYSEPLAVIVELDVCNAAGPNLNLTIADPKRGFSWSKVLSADGSVDVPGLSFSIGVVSAGVVVTYSIGTEQDELDVTLGLQLCGGALGFEKCFPSAPLSVLELKEPIAGLCDGSLRLPAKPAKLPLLAVRQTAARGAQAGCSPNPCQSGETCCVTAAGAGCCPSANACCCPDKQHCCESGTKCVCQGSSCTGCSASSGSCDNSAMF